MTCLLLVSDYICIITYKNAKR